VSDLAIYSGMPPDVASAAQAAAERIRRRMGNAAADIIEVGRDLIATKKAVGHGNFLPWIEAEFGMSDRTARRFMDSAETFGSKSEQFRICLPPSFTPSPPPHPKAPRAAAFLKTDTGSDRPAGKQNLREHC
jgi:hypothetical protein